ncbi:MAG: hypothetical protein CMP24_05540 [Rickettsiales bacterium]|nr:hypothetical protein [Rickettsiales bacterium]
MIGLLYLFIGIVILYFSGEWLVNGATSLARNLKIQPFIVAMTLVAFGTSAPELAISVNAAIKGFEGITIGNIVGSNIANILFALPVAFLIKIPKKSDVKKIDCIFLLIITLLYSLILLTTEHFSFYLGVIMIITLCLYIFFIIYEAKVGGRKFEVKEEEILMSLPKSFIFSLIGIMGVFVGAEILVKGAVNVANFFNVSQTIIGLSLVAIGTSIPEVATSVVAAYRGQINFILGAILGSNLFNLLGITGTASVITPIITKDTVDLIDIYYLIFSMLVFVLIAFYIRFLNRTLIVLLLLSYIMYILFLYIKI